MILSRLQYKVANGSNGYLVKKCLENLIGTALTAERSNSWPVMRYEAIGIRLAQGACREGQRRCIPNIVPECGRSVAHKIGIGCLKIDRDLSSAVRGRQDRLSREVGLYSHTKDSCGLLYEATQHRIFIARSVRSITTSSAPLWVSSAP